MTRIARASWAAFMALAVAATALEIAYERGEGRTQSVAMIACFSIIATVGSLLVSRRSRHPIGWIYLLGATAGGVGVLAHGLAALDRTTQAVPVAWVVWWVKGVFGVVPLLVLVGLPLLFFPGGTLPSRRWRPLLWIAVAAIAAVSATPALVAGHFDEGGAAPTNPLGVATAKRTLEALNTLGLLALGIVVVAAIVSLFRRYRRSSGVERQQLRWLAWAGVWTIVLLFMSGPGTYGGFLGDRVTRMLVPVTPFMFALALASIPLAITVAILRFRLWEIDRIVSRTVSYAIITAILVGFYAVIAIGIPAAFLGSKDTPDALIAAGTLAAAAAFGPVRRRVQSRVDRRFNRARYDATKTVEEFAARLREQVDIDALDAELRVLVGRTMHPRHVNLWLKP